MSAPWTLTNQPYAHLISIDVTPIWVQFEDSVQPTTAEEYTYENAAYVHVFVPVMYSIMPTSGDQYARMKVDWTGVEKIENPEENLQYRLWSAKQIAGTAYTGESYETLQNAIGEVTAADGENLAIQPNYHVGQRRHRQQPILEQKEFTAEEQAAMVQKLNDAMDCFGRNRRQDQSQHRSLRKRKPWWKRTTPPTAGLPSRKAWKAPKLSRRMKMPASPR